ncbi:RDD family protein [Mycobacterium sp. DSM 3803]|nr:RDD family protein [Mycobacterium sp. DSM 3803]
MVPGQPCADGGNCRHCGTALRPNAPFCGSCGQAVVNRQYQQPHPTGTRGSVVVLPSSAPAPNRIVGAGRGVRCACYLMDVAVMLSPALPLGIAGAILGVAEVVYIVVPVAFVAVWVWMQIWQGYTGMTFGKSMLGARLIRVADNKAPGLAACITRGGIFGATAGLAALPVVVSQVPHDGLHDRLTGVTVIDVVQGANPLGAKRDAVFRRAPDRGLNKVAAPLPVNTSGRR